MLHLHPSMDTVLEDLKKRILNFNPKANLTLVEKAYSYAKKAHKGQKRVSGEPFCTHPIEVAKILIFLKSSTTTIAASLLHDVVEDTDVKTEDINKDFGEEIASIVEGVTKVDKIHFQDKADYTAENLRKMLLATTKDIRVMLIKLADRLHNMRTLKYVAKEKRTRIAQETMDIYAPIAHKLGMWRIKGELEDLSLRYLEPEVYKFLSDKISQKRKDREQKTKEIRKKIMEMLSEKKISAMIEARAKYFTSIYRKMKRKNLDFDEIHDLIGIRIITKTIPDCYGALGVIHNLWNPIPKRFKDYISIPKANGYQSLHTAVMSQRGEIIEVQIRTEDMHNNAEYGVAAHWRYSGTERDKKFDKRISWIKQLLDWKRYSDNARDFIDTFKIDMFENEIVVFTPKGDPITLPEDSTPVDFAYEVHTDLGNQCSKSLINNKLLPLGTRLHSGDIVQIITEKNAQPSRQWLSFVKTSKAKGKIKSFLKMTREADPKRARKIQESQQDSGTQPVQENIVGMLKLEGKQFPVRLAKCCNPSIDDKIVGFYTKDKKVTVHKKDCKNLTDFKGMKKAVVYWLDNKSREVTRLLVTVNDQVGVLADILTKIANHNVNVKHINSSSSGDKRINLSIVLDNTKGDLLKALMQDLRNSKEVLNVAEQDQ